MPSRLTLSDSLQASLNHRLSSWAQRFGPTFILGLSGGGDSMALAVGCAQWMQTGHGIVHAVCVDHGLRDESRLEAQQTVAWAQALGLATKIVPVDLKRGQSRLQEAARAARHGALLTEARTHNARVILLGHNLDDQYETLALRLASKTGLDGLAGISPLSPSAFYQDDWPCLIGRPFLGVSRARLRQDLAQAGQNWHDDPSNNNSAFARIRARKRLSALQALGADISALKTIADHASALRLWQDTATHKRLQEASLDVTDARITVSFEVLLAAQDGVCERALGWFACAVGRSDYTPDGAKLKRLREAIRQPKFSGATLAGAKFYRRGTLLCVSPAPPRTRTTLPSHNKGQSIALRLRAISFDLNGFVTYLG